MAYALASLNASFVGGRRVAAPRTARPVAARRSLIVRADAGDKVKGAAKDAKDAVGGALNKAEGAASKAADKAGNLVSEGEDQAKDVKNQAKGKASEAKGKAEDVKNEAKSS